MKTFIVTSKDQYTQAVNLKAGKASFELFIEELKCKGLSNEDIETIRGNVQL